MDPTCCCAEQVDQDLAVRVEFSGPLQPDDKTDMTSFTHYFSEEELVKVLQDNDNEAVKSNLEQASTGKAFDGMSCVAFKLEQLEQNRKRAKDCYDS